MVVAPPGSRGATLLLARAATPEQGLAIGNQSGGRVFLFLDTDDFWRDYEEMRRVGVRFVREPKDASYGTVAVFENLYGNLWDLVQLTRRGPAPEAEIETLKAEGQRQKRKRPNADGVAQLEGLRG